MLRCFCSASPLGPSHRADTGFCCLMGKNGADPEQQLLRMTPITTPQDDLFFLFLAHFLPAI